MDVTSECPLIDRPPHRPDGTPMRCRQCHCAVMSGEAICKGCADLMTGLRLIGQMPVIRIRDWYARAPFPRLAPTELRFPPSPDRTV